MRTLTRFTRPSFTLRIEGRIMLKAGDIVEFIVDAKRIGNTLCVVAEVRDDDQFRVDGGTSWWRRDHAKLVGKTLAAIEELESQLNHFPHTKDGCLVYPGVTVYCRKGHPHVVQQSETGRRIYCRTGECLNGEHCGGDGSSGTHHNILDCTGTKHE